MAWSTDIDGRGDYSAHWESDNGRDRVDGGVFGELSPALAWARARSEIVSVRPSWDQGTYYWAGSRPSEPGEPELDESGH